MATLTESQREAYEERAAIMQYDGGLDRATAERKAMEAITGVSAAGTEAIAEMRRMLGMA